MLILVKLSRLEEVLTVDSHQLWKVFSKMFYFADHNEKVLSLYQSHNIITKIRKKGIILLMKHTHKRVHRKLRCFDSHRGLHSSEKDECTWKHSKGDATVCSSTFNQPLTIDLESQNVSILCVLFMCEGFFILVRVIHFFPYICVICTSELSFSTWSHNIVSMIRSRRLR